MNTQTIKLKNPIIIGSETIEELTLRKPIVDDLLVMDEAEGDVDRQIRLISALASVPPGTVKKNGVGRFFLQSVRS